VQPRIARGDALYIFACSAAIGLLISTEFLAQPFVWSGWPLDEVLAGWFRIAQDRLLVALAIAACLVAVRALPLRGRLVQWILPPCAVLAGSMVGEGARSLLDPSGDVPGFFPLAGRVLHWTFVGLAVTAILACWQMNADYAGVAQQAEAEAARSRRALLAFELDALQRELEPHFLFNTLATIKRFGQTVPAAAQSLLDRLFAYIAAMLRTTQQQESDLGSELDLVHAYLDVCAVRMDGRLSVRDSIPPDLRASKFPPLMLGTLVENAVRHGITPSTSGGTIVLEARREGAVLEVSVQDDGVGLVGDGGTGLGLANLSTRLALLYGADASLQLREIAPHGVCATIRLPHAQAA
jgi:signal transduction histidine kinase